MSATTLSPLETSLGLQPAAILDLSPPSSPHQPPAKIRMATLNGHTSPRIEPKRKQSSSYGVCFDVDGVLARGTKPIQAALKAVKRLCDDGGKFRVPVTFVTNSLSRKCDKARQLSEMLGVEVRPEQVILAPSPLEIFTRLHDKSCLLVGQGKILDIARELGFKKVYTVDDVAKAYPLLDVVDHDNRKRNETIDVQEEKDFPKIEAIILMGEPKRWESALQIIIDLLRTNGQPNLHSNTIPLKHIPVVACNMDLEFKDRAATPRFGHGAFLACLESLFQKLSGRELQYSALVGKPSEITFRFTEHVLTRESKSLGYTQPVKHMYLIGDTPDVDIVGSNLYQQYIDGLTSHSDVTHSNQSDLHINGEFQQVDLPDSRTVPSNAEFHYQSVQKVLPILVCTGVYQPPKNSAGSDSESLESDELCHSHRDFPRNHKLKIPKKICDDVDEAVCYILKNEGDLLH